MHTAPRLRQILELVRGAFSRDREVRVRLSAEVEATIYDCPGTWMSKLQLDALRSELTAVARSTIPGALDYGVFLPGRAPYANRLVVVGRHLGRGETVGFNAMPRLELDLPEGRITLLHLGLLVIHADYQRQGLQGQLYGLGAFSSIHRLRERPVWISNVSEVPAVIGAVCDYFIDVYPSYTRAPPPPPRHQAIARAIMAQHRHEFGVGPEAGFDDERFVITSSYTGGSDALKKTFESAPRYRNEAANAFCARELDYGRGDDFLQIGQVDTSVITGWLTRRIPEELRPAAARKMKLWSYPAAKGKR